MVKNMYIIETKEIFELFKTRKPESNKGDYGRALIIAGSYGMAGAAAIAAKSALACGVGICEVVCPDSIYNILASCVLEAVFTPIKMLEDTIEEKSLKMIDEAINRANSIAIGCGMGKSNYTKTILEKAITNSKVPLIIDADGINCLADNIQLLRRAKCPVILTPHPGEMARLCKMSVDEVQKSRMKTAVDFATENGVILALKGHNTIIAAPNGNAYINMTGNAGMATGGTGDMLSGMIVALSAQGMPAIDAVKAAVHIHGLSGDAAAKELSMQSILPTSMIQYLPKLFLEIELAAKLKGD